MKCRFHPEVLTAARRKVLLSLGPSLSRRGCYLGGGTALALYLGHRRSVDFDWFTPDKLRDPEALARGLRAEGIRFLTGSVESGTLLGTVGRIRISIMTFQYPLLNPLQPWSDYHCRLGSLVDLAAMKLLALAQRGSRKDFVDIHALSKQGISLPKMLRWYQEKFSITDTAHVLYSLVYFDDAERQPMPVMIQKRTWRTVKKELREWVKSASG